MSTGDPSAMTLAVDVVPVITAGINAAGAIVKLTDDELNILNSPANIASRKAFWEQKQRELDAEAVAKAQTGDLESLQERSS